MFFKIIIIVVDVDLIGISNVLRVSQKWSLIQGRKEGNILFNDALNTFYFTVIWRRTYGKGPLR